MSPEDRHRRFLRVLLGRRLSRLDWDAIGLWIDHAVLRLGKLEIECGHDTGHSVWEWELVQEAQAWRQERPRTEVR